MNQQSSLLASLLAPGVRFVQNLRFTEKFLLVCMLLLIPLTYAGYYLLDDVHQHVQEKQLEMDGLQYAVHVSELLELIPQHRGMTNGLLHGDESFRARIAALQPSLEKALADADAADRLWGGELRLHEQWQQVRSRWTKLLGDTGKLTAEASWQQHTALIADYLDMVLRITINSTLYTEDDPATRHLIEVNFHYLPQLIEALGQMRGGGSGMIADGKTSHDEQHEFSRLIMVVLALSHDVRRNMTFAFEISQPLQSAFEGPTHQVIGQAEDYVKLVQSQILQPAVPAISAPLYFDRGSEAISSGYRLLKMTTEYIHNNLELEIRHLSVHRNILIITFILGALIIGYLIVAFYISIRNITSSLKDVVGHLQRGDMPPEVIMPGRDELGNIIQLFNQLSGQLISTNIKLLQSQREDQLLRDISLLALQHDDLNQFARTALILIAAASPWLPIRPCGQINLLRNDKKFYIAATHGMDPVLLAATAHLPETHIERIAENHILFLPFVIGGECVGELLLLLLSAETLPMSMEVFMPRLTDAITIAVGRLSAESALQQREVDLLRSNEELERFAYISSHDLQEPLRKIRSFGDRLLSGTELNGRSLDFLQRMVAAAGRMQELIEDLLTYSRVNASQRPFVPTDLNQVVAEACNTLELQIEETQAKIHVGPLATIEADKIQMVQLFQNLIGNALKYRREGVPPIITITIEETGKSTLGDMLHLSCQDNGIGFEMQYAGQIFEAFKRLHSRGEYSGSGIGLSICRRIVERHGGTIYATSEPGVGTCMHLSLQLSHKDS